MPAGRRRSSSSRRVRAEMPVQSRPVRRGRPALPALPEMGGTLRVVMLAVDEEQGVARLGLRDSSHIWEVTVDAQRSA